MCMYPVEFVIAKDVSVKCENNKKSSGSSNINFGAGGKIGVGPFSFGASGSSSTEVKYSQEEGSGLELSNEAP